MALTYEKASSDKIISVYIGPTATGVLGVTDVNEPLAAELNNTGGTSGMMPASQSISWNDWSFGIQASETLNEPSLADASTYEEFGRYNFGGAMSFWMPASYDDNSNLHSVIYDLTETAGTKLDVVLRLDGNVKTSTAAADGDFVSVYRVQGEGETNPFTPGESKRRTVNFIQKSEFSHQVVVGAHTVTAIDTTVAATVGDAGRIRAAQQGRDVTNYLDVPTSNGAVVDVFKGGFWSAVGAGSATVTFTDPGTGDTDTVAFTVS